MGSRSLRFHKNTKKYEVIDVYNKIKYVCIYVVTSIIYIYICILMHVKLFNKQTHVHKYTMVNLK